MNERKKNREAKAFELFGKGKKAYQVARELGIPEERARMLWIIFLKSEYLSPEEQEEITQCYLRRLQVESAIKESQQIFIQKQKGG